MSSRAIPFVVGQWVRGDRFYGRAAQLDEILHGPRNLLWLLGTRRIGKTSLLKQLEHITASSRQHGFFPLFWDFQGAEDPDELLMGFNDALLDSEERLEGSGIKVSDVEADDLFTSLGRLRRRLGAQDTKLLLLCDEVEELLKLYEKDPSFLRKLRRALQSHEDIRSVLASTIRLWQLAEEKEDTSPFLHGFTPPLYIRALEDDEARALIRQTNLRESLTAFSDEAVELVRSRCDNHPYLIQLVCKRFLELGGGEDLASDAQTEKVEEALELVATDEMVSYFFSVDFEMLSDLERSVIGAISEQSPMTSDSIRDALAVDAGTLNGCLQRLQNLGFIHRLSGHRVALANYFFRLWIRQTASQRGRARGLGSSPSWEKTPGGATEFSIATGLRSAEETAWRLAAYPGGPGLFDRRYRLLERAGKGTSATVFKAFDTLLEVHIAVKLLHPDYSSNKPILDRFRQEILLSRDIGHPNIVRIYHFSEFEGKQYITMQWVEGSTLAEYIANEAPCAEERILTIGIKIASALEAAHSKKILHRDIKPQNILLDESGEPLIADFGLARLLGHAGMTRSGMFLGTPYYSSPEQANLLPLDERSDLYSLGLILYEMATGQRPFAAEETDEVLALHRNALPTDPRELRPELSAELSKLILDCLEKEPSDRIASAGKLREKLESIREKR